MITNIYENVAMKCFIVKQQKIKNISVIRKKSLRIY